MSTDSASIDQLRERFQAQLARAANSADLKALHDEFLSRKSAAITGLMKALRTLPPDHPGRDMQDTLYLEAPIEGGKWGAHRFSGEQRGTVPDAQVRAAPLLRPHPSAMKIRYMKTFPPPIRIIVPGRVYRRDNLDLSHTPMFQQFEGLVVGEGITLGDLKGTLEAMMRELFGDVKVRLRPSFFPYTEPSAEVDVSCRNCGGSGCGTCKQTGWVEILGSGMVHPAVFQAGRYAHQKATGVAFGM